MGDKAFYGCSGFKDINFQSSDADTKGFNWQSLLKCKSLSVGDKAFYFNGAFSHISTHISLNIIICNT